MHAAFDGLIDDLVEYRDENAAKVEGARKRGDLVMAAYFEGKRDAYDAAVAMASGTRKAMAGREAVTR